jgi:predicted fused transcriptional regulator/phosphomethylpyrimidine kinase
MDSTASAVMTALIEAGNIDTVYRDVYLDRARTVLAPVLSLEDFHRLEQERAALAELPLTIARALDRANWSLVKELSQRAQTLKRAIDDQRALLETARSIYDVRDVRLDPFSPGLEPFTRVATRELAALRTRMLEALRTLERADVAWKDLYAARRGAFQARPEMGAEMDTDPTSSPTDPLESARQALKAGDLTRLAALADALNAAGTPDPTVVSHAATVRADRVENAPRQVLQPAAYSSETVARARHLGLTPHHLEPRMELASLRRYAWTPASDERGLGAAAQVPLPSGSPEGLRDGVAMFAIHPLVNSGGARYLPSLVAEDVLVEDFPDPADGQTPATSELLKNLRLSSRRGLPRIAIEQALLTYGARTLEKELGLDPRVFRLVCIPPDVYVRVGQAEGWGRQPFWTHFDGYLIRTVSGQVRLQALAGGDVRYGGLYELLGVGREYDSDRLLARFAVVQRARMAAW